MKFHTVTTMSAAGYEAYGVRMLSSFLLRWPAEVKPLAVYAEGFSTHAEGLELRALPAWLDAFKSHNAGNSDARGMARGVYDFKRDAIKFSHKVAAITDAAERVDDGILIWLDADTFTHAEVTVEWLESLLPSEFALGWLSRIGMYPETGFLMFNLGHPGARELLRRFRAIYETDELFALPETHDAYVLQHLVSDMFQDLPWASLSGDAAQTSHPMARGPLAACLDHRKGPRKPLDHSPEHRVLA